MINLKNPVISIPTLPLGHMQVSPKTPMPTIEFFTSVPRFWQLVQLCQILEAVLSLPQLVFRQETTRKSRVATHKQTIARLKQFRKTMKSHSTYDMESSVMTQSYANTMQAQCQWVWQLCFSRYVDIFSECAGISQSNIAAGLAGHPKPFRE